MLASASGEATTAAPIIQVTTTVLPAIMALMARASILVPEITLGTTVTGTVAITGRTIATAAIPTIN